MIIILARRDGKIFVPHGNSVMQLGDVPTRISESAHRPDVQRVIEGLYELSQNRLTSGLNGVIFKVEGLSWRKAKPF